MPVYYKIKTHCEKNVTKLKGLKWSDFIPLLIMVLLFERV